MQTRLLPDTPAGIETASAILRAGGLVAFGTETVYGLGADAGNDRAVAAIYAAKGRPGRNPLISHFASAKAAFAQVEATELARLLAARFWPGPLTMVLPHSPGCTISPIATAGLGTAAVRVPAGATTLALLAACGFPVVAPSANPSGKVSPSDAQHVMAGLAGRIDAVLDCGPCPVGVESTIIDLSGPRPVLLRPGGITLEALEEACGMPVALPQAASNDARPSAPGQLSSHYAPGLPVRLDATAVGTDEALLAFGAPLAGSPLVWNLSESGDLHEAAARLFAGLRFLDMEGQRRGLVGIAVQPVPRHALGRAIRDRLTRAACPRS
ncbi:threonylcarbamoyl-AMP synthase [Komagataeibacter nataicola]|uniref:Threonylcarbamoyl-AMP synthase n=1 Tax=Komagataeibacter nataicola TaxID=265960 RepID=A0A9N7CBP3_9PROT|nr:L-threonylcarbamoyladenylate synthase [Komagataeibacter nataicola]AQU88886.1 threonylcarbamoyl-AMP synthase [Komagataeibacter nataicola]PYD68033.1 threonylcarbamoyl-AMP synthase [Komagataeibacter nataicola]WEQ57223.1 L-threonylcarbamoyladenylate synthase [Komagataeibacter nataicola]WNM10125.1 L-threonylcarbamoyladenylate synthase [Komagataeibacter nataicola]GBR24090.1 translation modulator Sua5/YciO/YrdC/YwlC [Komagataeibacter nataicola NRIC 0616]